MDGWMAVEYEKQEQRLVASQLFLINSSAALVKLEADRTNKNKIKYVIHTVGPIAQKGVGEVEKKALRSCYKNSLEVAAKNGARSVVRTKGSWKLWVFCYYKQNGGRGWKEMMDGCDEENEGWCRNHRDLVKGLSLASPLESTVSVFVRFLLKAEKLCDIFICLCDVGYPPEQAVHEALATVREYLDEHDDELDRVIFCVFLPADKELYLQNLPLYFPADRVERHLLYIELNGKLSGPCSLVQCRTFKDVSLAFKPLNLRLWNIISLEGLTSLQPAGWQWVMAPNVKIQVITHSRWIPFKPKG
ncbi:O-acetyl-ADP-ribose deacetylase MACROD1 [Collichthys lucidus]|uniref:O-acetyl-ADP-ribose deacetylase MACROD1 n=1 Tax=Collichthys lucidus TaxID=240159 RepID=A0A4U5UE16_COLLU|nr:O-acetyl-ADP-ribose deacetylase MACROD1 [Collichthys lucidus]